jgi:hypothetical protein
LYGSLPSEYSHVNQYIPSENENTSTSCVQFPQLFKIPFIFQFYNNWLNYYTALLFHASILCHLNRTSTT